MMNTQQPKALQLAEHLETSTDDSNAIDDEIAAELRRLHSVNAELLEALKMARIVINPMHTTDIAWIDAAIAKAQE
jgi:hypothetical protein